MPKDKEDAADEAAAAEPETTTDPASEDDIAEDDADGIAAADDDGDEATATDDAAANAADAPADPSGEPKTATNADARDGGDRAKKPDGGAAAAEDAASAGAAPVAAVRSALRIEIPASRAGYMIGPRGAIVKYLRDSTQCGVHVQEGGRSHRVVVVTSSDAADHPELFHGVDGVLKCHLRATEQEVDLHAPPGTDGARPAGEYVARVVIPSSQLAGCVGEIPEEEDVAPTADADADADANANAAAANANAPDATSSLPGVAIAADIASNTGASIALRPKTETLATSLPADRVVEIRGSDDCVRSALLIIARKLDHRTNPPSEDEDPLRLIDAPDVKEGYFRQKQEAFAKEFAAKGYKHNPHGRSPDPIPVGQCMMTFVVRPEFAGGLIGKRGSAITAMRDASGAKITVHDNGRLSGDPNALRTVEINGTEAQCWHARKLIEKGVVDQGGAPCAEARVQKEGEIPDLPAYLLEYKPGGQTRSNARARTRDRGGGDHGDHRDGRGRAAYRDGRDRDGGGRDRGGGGGGGGGGGYHPYGRDRRDDRAGGGYYDDRRGGWDDRRAGGWDDRRGGGGGGWDDRGGWNRERGYQEQERGGWGGGWDGGGAYGQQQQWGGQQQQWGQGQGGQQPQQQWGGQGQQQGYGGEYYPDQYGGRVDRGGYGQNAYAEYGANQQQGYPNQQQQYGQQQQQQGYQGGYPPQQQGNYRAGPY